MMFCVKSVLPRVNLLALTNRKQLFVYISRKFTSQTIPVCPSHNLNYTTEEVEILSKTNNWVRKVIIGQHLCPFAMKPHRENSIRYVISWCSNDEELLQVFEGEVDKLIANKDNEDGKTTTSTSINPLPTTTLLILPNKKYLVNDYFSQISLSYKLMDHLTGRDLTSPETNPKSLTIVNFHPKAKHSLYATSSFADSDGSLIEDPKSYSIRSPFPTIHLLRESDILQVLKDKVYPNPELIPDNNARKLEALGITKVRQIWGEVGVD